MNAAGTGNIFVVAAPSGAGKTTVCRQVVSEDPNVELSVSHTTRLLRVGERDGVHYHFVSRERFTELVDAHAFLEWAEYNRNFYGTSWVSIEEPVAAGRDVLLEIEVQGAAQVRERRDDARLIFLLPPSLKVLEERLRGRGTDSEDEIGRRLVVARGELEAAPRFDFAVLNDDLGKCVAAVATILDGCRRGRSDELRERFAPARALAEFGA
ncbi:MAG: guanylate kinase [Deltaproteobacteria bacterium]|nr:guanylate kinase [Deltaproteobacteria bacterium]MBW2361489.1 guanylate kinase [Deltaproteobacteria bacterium]